MVVFELETSTIVSLSTLIMYVKYINTYTNLLIKKNKLNYNLFTNEDLQFIEKNDIFFEYMFTLLPKHFNNIADNSSLLITLNKLNTHKELKKIHNSNEFIIFIISLSFLYAYINLSKIMLDNECYKKKRDLIFLSSFNLNKILQNISQIGDSTYEYNSWESLFLHICGYMETNGVLGKQTFFNGKKKDNLVLLNILIDINPLVVDLLGIHTTPIHIHTNSNYPYYIGLGFSNNLSYIRDNNFGNKSLKILNFTFLKKMCSQKYFIQYTLLIYAINTLFSLFNLKCTSSDELLLNLNKNYIYYNKNVTKIDANYSKILQIYWLYSFYENYTKFIEGFFYTYYCDFRGRFYSDSQINYSNNRWIRCLLDFGTFSEYEINSFKLPELDRHLWNKLNLNFNVENDMHRYFIIKIYYELGKIIKSSLPNYTGIINYEDFINLGIKLANDHSNKIYKLKDLDLYEKTILVFKLQKHDMFYKHKFIFFRDATASGLQMLSLLLKPKNEEVKKWLNLSNDGAYYDTYMYIINSFYEKYSNHTEYREYFTRKTLKKTIMIFNYQGSYYTCLTDFLLFLPKETPLLVKAELEKIFKDFYNHLHNIFNETEIFQFSANNIFHLFKLSNPQLSQQLTTLMQTNNNIKITQFINSFSSLNEKWLDLIKINKPKLTKFGESKPNESLLNDLYVDINDYLTMVDKSDYIYELDTFFSLMKKHNLLKFFKIFFKRDKFLLPLNYNNYNNSLGHLPKDKVMNFLKNLLISHTLINPHIFHITFNDGFTVNFDYVQNIEKKIDIKQNYTYEMHEFNSQLAKKYKYEYKTVIYKYRATLNINDKAKQINFEKIESAIKANLIHALDSYFIRQFIIQSDSPCITIHDCIGCDLFNYGKINPLMCSIYSKLIIVTTCGTEVVITNDVKSEYLLL